MSNVYIFKLQNYMKVGMSDNPERRLVDINSCIPFDAELVFSKNYRSEKIAYIIEHQIHNKLKDNGFHEKNEWFIFSERSLNCALLEIKWYTQERAEAALSSQEEMKEIILKMIDYGKSHRHVLSKILAEKGFDSESTFVKLSNFNGRKRHKISKEAIEESRNFFAEITK